MQERIVTDGHPLPFKHLRKRAGDLIRRLADGEIAGIFLLYGNPVQIGELGHFSKVPDRPRQLRPESATFHRIARDGFALVAGIVGPIEPRMYRLLGKTFDLGWRSAAA